MIDLVYVVRPGDDNEPLRYSLRSLVNLPHGRVVIAGHKPGWVRNVEHVPVPQRGNRFDNSTANLRAAAGTVDRFAYMNDDFFITEPIEDIPYYHMGPVAAQWWASSTEYARGARLTAALLEEHGVPHPLCYETHTPMIMESDRLIEVLDLAAGVSPLHKRTLYGSYHRVGGEHVADPKATTANGPLPTGPFLSTSPVSWKGEAGRRIRAVFTEPSPYEKE